jgi:glycosyltransferase involved in cell wall biosynthesis
MKILWLTWKDPTHPHAGGAEVVQRELCKRLTADGHEVTILTASYPGAAHEDTLHGCRIIRVGGRFSVYWHAYRYYKKHLVGWADIVIDETNTIPFFAKYYVKEPHLMFFHQLCREIWFYQMRFPLSLIGYLLEPLYLRLLSGSQAIVVSESTKRDLMRHGFKAGNIHIISEGIELEPLTTLKKIEKYPQPTLLSLGAIRPMKRTLDIIKAFEIIKSQATTPFVIASEANQSSDPSSSPSALSTFNFQLSNLRLIIAGDTSGKYGEKVLQYIENSPHKADIEVLGRVSTEKKLELMQKSHAIAVTSVKEGWGLIVTEAASQGTPAVVYNVDGLRDSVQHRNTGLVCTRNSPEELAVNIANLLTVPQFYDHVRTRGWEWSKKVTFDQAHKDFMGIIKNHG